MSELFRHDITLFRKFTAGDERRVPAGDVVCNVYRESSVVASPSSIADGAGATVTVYDPGAIVAGDTVQKGTDSSVTRTVTSIGATSIVLATGSGALSLAQYDRLVPTNSRPTTWRVDRDDSGNPTTAVASQATTDSTSGTASFYTAEAVVDVIANDGGTLTHYPDQCGVGGKRAYTPQIYGARGDIGTDDSGAFMDLAEFLKVRPGIFEVPPGNYLLSSNIPLSSVTGMKIRGAGPNLCTLLINHSGEGFTLTGCTDVEISGFTVFRGTGSSAFASTNTACSRTVFKDIWFTGGGTGILDRGIDSTLENLWFGAAGSQVWTRMIHLYSAVRPHLRNIRSLFTGTVAQACIDIDTDVIGAKLNQVNIAPATVSSDNGIVLRIAANSAGANSPEDIVATACRFSGGTGAGGKQAVQIGGCLGAEFHACNAVNSLIGYDIDAGFSIKILGGSTVGIQNDGIDIDGGNYIDIIGHTSSNVNVGAGSADHVSIAAGCDDVQIIGLRVGRFIQGATAQARYGVSIAAGASDRIQVMGLTGVAADLASGWISNASTSTDVDLSHNLVGGHIYLASSGTPSPAVVSVTTADATPSVKGAGRVYLQQPPATTITNFDDAVDGQMIVIFAGNGNTTIADGGNFSLSAAYTSAANDTLTLVWSDTLLSWCEVCRSNN